MQTDDTNKKIQFNTHNKQEDKPSHTAEHLLNQTMIRLMECERAIKAHIEAKKSKMDFALQTEPTPEQITQIENKMNEIKTHLNWSKKVILRSKIFGVLNEERIFTDLFPKNENL